MDLHLVVRVPDPAGEGEASAFSIDDISCLSAPAARVKTMMCS